MRGSWAVVLLSGLLVLGGCGDDDGGGAGGSSGAGSAGKGAAGGGAGTSSDSSGGSSGQGASGSTGSGTNAGKGGSAAGNGSAGSAGGAQAGEGGRGGGRCDIDCPPNARCELVEVQCIRAPCNPVPMCVEVSSGAGDGGASAGSGSGGSGGSASGGSGKTCGTRGAGPCPDGEFCDFPAGADCGRADAPGKCATQPSACTREYDPVCGCDGETYSNACTAHAAGVSVETEGECENAAAGTRCVGPVRCTALPAKCPDLQVHTIENGCYGPCVSIDECKCSGPEDCPDENEFTCHLSAGHCGPYV